MAIPLTIIMVRRSWTMCAATWQRPWTPLGKRSMHLKWQLPTFGLDPVPVSFFTYKDTSSIELTRTAKEVGMDLTNLGAKRVCVVTDSNIAELDAMKHAIEGLSSQGIDFTVYDKVRVEPKDSS